MGWHEQRTSSLRGLVPCRADSLTWSTFPSPQGDGASSDPHHLYPADGYVNNLRGNHPYGEVLVPEYTSTNGCVVGQCKDYDIDESCFEIADEYKGDVARAAFYLSVAYRNEWTCCDEDESDKWNIKVRSPASAPSRISRTHVSPRRPTWRRRCASGTTTTRCPTRRTVRAAPRFGPTSPSTDNDRLFPPQRATMPSSASTSSTATRSLTTPSGSARFPTFKCA